MLAKHLKRLLGSTAIAGLSFALAYPALAQTTYKTGTSVNVGQTSDTQLSRDELNEDTHHDRIEEELDSEDRNEDARHEMRVQQLEAAQTPLKPQHIADENEFHADQKKEIAQKKAIEDARHQSALAAIMAAAKSLIGGAAGALGNAANGGGGGAPPGSSPPPNSGGSAGNPPYPGGINNYPIPGSGSPGNPNNGGGTANNPNYPGGINNYPIPGSGSPGNPNNGGGTANNPNYPGGINNYPIPGSGSPGNPNNGGGTANNPNYPGGINNYPIPNSGGGSAGNPSGGAGSASNPNAGGSSPNNPRLTGDASSNANGAGTSPTGPGAGQRPLDFIPNALNGFVNQFQNGGQNLQNASNAMRGVAQTFEDQWTKPNGGINQVAAMAAFHGIGGALKYLAPAIKGAASEAAANAPAIVAKAAAATTGIVARAKNFAAKLFGRGPPTEPVNPTESLTGGTSAGEPGASNLGENPAAAKPPNDLPDLTDQPIKIGGRTFDLGVSRGAGKYGTVYDIKNMPGFLLKVVTFDQAGADSIGTQLAGKALVDSATTIATPAMENASAQGLNAVIVQDVTKAFQGGTAFGPTDVATPAQKAAIKAMFDEMGKNGLVWEDGGLRNVFVYDTPNGLRAGILDTDRIFRLSEMGSQPSEVQGSLAARLQSFLAAAAKEGKPLTAKDYMDELYKLYYSG